MNKKILFGIFLCIPFWLSCSSGDAVSWNTKLMEVYNQTVIDVDDFQELISLETIGDTTVNRHIVIAAELILTNAEKEIKRLSAAEIPSGGEACQTALLEMLESVKSQINIGLKFTSFTDQTTVPEIDKYAEDYDEASLKTAGKATAFEFAQHKFADKIGLIED